MRGHVIVAVMMTVAPAGGAAELKLRATGGATGDAPAIAVQPRIPTDAGRAVHELSATDLHGTVWTLERLQGRVVLIDFWATWCAPCLSELPRLKELRARYTRDEFEILGVMLDVSSRRDVISWLNRNRIDWPQIHERNGYNGALPAAFGVQQLPATVLVDGNGTIAATGLRGDALRQRIEGLVLKSVAPPKASREGGSPALQVQSPAPPFPVRSCSAALPPSREALRRTAVALAEAGQGCLQGRTVKALRSAVK